MPPAFQRLRETLRYLPVGRTLYSAFGVMLALTALVAAIAFGAIDRVDDTARRLADKWLAGIGHLAEMRTEVREYRELEVKHSRTENPKNQTSYEDGMAALAKSIGAHLDAVGTAFDDEGERARVATLKAAWAGYLEFGGRVVAHGRAGKHEDAIEASDFGAKTAFQKNIDSLNELVAASLAGGQAAAAQAHETTQRTTAILAGIAAAAMLIGALLAWSITRRLLNQLGGEPRAAVLVARAVADGDLGTAIDPRHGDARSLLARLAAMQASLSRTVMHVRHGAESVATASVQIAQGNQDLSARTEQQASALQQTASTMEELGTTVRHNADNARQADQLAQGASAVATRGGEVVGRVVDTMKGITDSSRQIAEIISVIDGIAFQTNILALNAAVEAARAGDQGRGFAVVAAEVRSLAQRSAQAAKEIKGLIDTSVQRVEQGTTLVDEAGRTMQEVVGAIRRVSDIVGEISAASVEQSTGVAQVGQAIAQLDETTQRNAALVEQSAAAAESMRQQAQQLVAAVAVFRVGAEPARPVPAPETASPRPALAWAAG